MDLTRNWEGRRRRRKTGFGGRGTERTERNCGGGEEEPAEADQGEMREKEAGLVLRGRIQASVRASGEPEPGRAALSAIKPVLRVRWCARPIGHAWISIPPRPWQLAGWIGSRWPHIRLWTRPVSLSTACRGLKGTSAIRATQRPGGLPDTPQTGPDANGGGHKHMQQGGVCVCVCPL